MSTMKDVVAEMRSLAPTCEFDWEAQLTGWADRLEALAQPPHGGAVEWQVRCRPTWRRNIDWPEWTYCSEASHHDYLRTPILHDHEYQTRALYTHPPQPLSAAEVDDLEWCERVIKDAAFNLIGRTPFMRVFSALRSRLAAPPVVVSEPDSPASIRASLEGIEPVGAGNGDECQACHKAWGEHRSGYSASRCKMRPAKATAPAALVDDAATFAAFDAANAAYDVSKKLGGDSHKRALLEACRAYAAALAQKDKP